MKILWLVNVVLPEAGELLNIEASVFGGWLTGALNGIRLSVERITVATVLDGIREIKQCDAGNVSYIVFPKTEKEKLADAFKRYLSENDFDVIQIFGTEMLHSAVMLSVAPKEKTVVFIQGLCSAITQHYLEGIPQKNIKENVIKKTLRLLTHKVEASAQTGYLKFCKMAENEKLALSDAVHVIGRTDFDRAFTFQINPRIIYHRVNETLRDSFYTEDRWSVEECERHRIFLSQAGYPVKGLHYFVRALQIVRRFYPDVQVYIGGGCGVCRKKGLKKARDKYLGGYMGYINTYLADNDLLDCIHSLGMLGEKEMAEQYLRANVFVCPSVIENSPNSVGEAMMMGTPVVASYVGGIPDMIDNGKEGLLYQPSAPYMLADCIMRIFSDDELALKLSENAVIRSHITHDKQKNAQALIAVYNEMLRKAEEKTYVSIHQ